MAALATTAQMEARLRLTLSGVDLAAAQAALDDASALVRAEAGRTWEAPGDTVTTPPDVVVTVVLQAALRSFQNPSGATSESLGDWSRSGVGSVYLTEDERWIVRSAAGVAFDAVGSVRTPAKYERQEFSHYMLSDFTDGLDDGGPMIP